MSRPHYHNDVSPALSQIHLQIFAVLLIKMQQAVIHFYCIISERFQLKYANVQKFSKMIFFHKLL